MTITEVTRNRVILAIVLIVGSMNGNGKKNATCRKRILHIGGISPISGVSKPCVATNERTSGSGGIASGWKNSACNINGKKCAAASGGKPNDTSKQCVDYRTKTSGNGDIVNGLNNNGTNMR